ncbi:MAG: hypothetical protein LBP28_06990, partial [Coriobacteriales bacterium]|nr:hypothetical protein [Coriobacteriales bacterium]
MGTPAKTSLKAPSRRAQKSLACLLAGLLAFGISPGAYASALAELPAQAQPFAEQRALLDELERTATAPGQGNVAQSDTAYLFGGKRYKVIYNDYIACYVSVDDGSFSVLPTTVAFDPNKPASRARFTINGEDYGFGEIRGNIDAGNGTILIPPVVEKDMVAAHYAVGDYVISQYLAITKDASHAGGYAVKVGYGAEYFGAQPATISGEIVIDTLLGTDDNLALCDESGTPLAAGAAVVPAPAALAVPEDSAGAKAFLVLNEDRGTAPQAATFGELAQLLAAQPGAAGGGAAGGGGGAAGAAVTDSALKLDFAPITTNPTTAAAATGQNAIAVFNTNYGFYDLSPAALSLTPAPAQAVEEDAALQPATAADAGQPDGDGAAEAEEPNGAGAAGAGAAGSAMTTLADAQGAHRIYIEAAKPNSISLLTQLPKNEHGESYVSVGDTISFVPTLINDGRITSRLELSYGKAVNGAQEQALLNLAPDENGVYTLTVPTDIYVDASDPDSNGQIGIAILTDFAEGAMQIHVDNNSFVGDTVQAYTVAENVNVSAAGVDLGHSKAALAGDTVTLVLERTVPGYLPTLEKFALRNYDTQSETAVTPNPVGGDTYTYDIPSYTGNVGLHIEIGSEARAGNTQIINRKIIASDPSGIGFAVETSDDGGSTYTPLALDAGLLRAPAGHSVKVPATQITSATWFAAQSTVALTAYNLSNGTQIATQNLKEDATDFTFPMPAANVELVLNLTANHHITTNIQYEAGGGPNSGASLAISPESPSAGQTVTVNVNLFGGGYKLAASNPLTAHKTGDSPAVALTTVVAGQSYTFTMPAHDVTVVLNLDNVASPPTMQTIATKPFVGEGQTVFGITYWTEKGDTTDDAFKAGALDTTSKTGQAAVGSTVRFYASKPPGVSTDWQLKRAYVIVGEGENAVEQAYGEESNQGLITSLGEGYYSFTMPDAPVTIGVEGQKDAAPGQIVTETKMLVNGQEYPYTGQGDAGNLQAYKLHAGALEKADGVLIGETVFIAAYPMLGGSLKSITVEQEGYAPLNITSTKAYNPQLNTDVFSFKALRGSVFKVTALYEASNKTSVMILGHEDDPDLEFIGERTRDLSFAQIYDPNASSRALNVASTVIELKTTDEHVGDYLYTLSEAANPSYGADDIQLELLEYKDGYSRYELTVNATSSKMPVELYVQKSDYSKRPVITGMTVNNSNQDKFNNLVITGENLRNLTQTVPYDYRPTIYLRQIGPGNNTVAYQVPRAALQPNAAGTQATLAVAHADLVLLEPAAAPAKPEFSSKYDYEAQIEWYWGSELGPMTLSDIARTSWTLNDASFDFKPNAEYCYAAVGLLHSFQFSYGVVAGETMETAKNNDAFSETYLTLECKGGFNISTSGGQTQLTLKDPASPVLVNGILTLEPSGSAGTSFLLAQSRDPGGLYNVTLSTNRRLVAKGTTVFSPVGSLGTLRMDFTSGKYYSATEEVLETPQRRGKSLPTFVPQGNITVDVLGYNGFSAEYHSIKLLPTKIQLAGDLLLQVPGIEMPLAGLALETLQLDLAKANPGFDGIKAVGEVGGSFAIITLQGKGEIDTFNNYYRFEGEVEIPVFEARGYLELVESQRFKIPMLEAFHMQVAGDKGIPLVPPVTIGYLNGFEGGVYGLAGTLDYDPTDPAKPILPPLRIAGGARFQLLELVEFWVELTAGAGYFKQSLHDAYVNLKGINFQVIEELTMEIGSFEDHPAGQRSRTVFGYNGRLRANLLKGIISDVFIAEGNLTVNASMDHPSYWLAKKDTYTDVLSLLQAINARFSASGNINGLLQVPKFALLGTNYGPFKIAEAGAWFDARIPLSSRIYTTCFRVGGSLSWGPVGIEVEYDFMQPASPPDFSFELFSAQGGAVGAGAGDGAADAGAGDAAGAGGGAGADAGGGALYAQAFGDTNSGGSIVIGEGMRVVADSFGALPTPLAPTALAPRSTSNMSALAVPDLSTTASISIYGDKDSFIHSISVPDDGKDHWIQAASLVAGEELDLTLYAPDGTPVALKPVPYNAESTAEQGEHGYNALRSQDGSGLLVCLDTPGEYKLTSNSEFRSWVMDANPAPELTESKLEGDAISFKAENLEDGARYFYKVMLEQKSSYNGDADSARVLQEEYFTADNNGEAAASLPLSNYNLNESLESGDYIPTVLLYRVSGTDDPATTDVDEEERELVSTGEIYTPITVVNSRAAAIAPGALGDLTVTAAGNESINLAFSRPTVAAGFGATPDDGDPSTNESASQPSWQPAYYQVDLYDETGQLATRAMDDNGAQTETPLSFTINDASSKDGRLDVVLAGIPGGHSYTAEVTPVYTARYEAPAAVQQTMTLGLLAIDSNTGTNNNTISLEQKGSPVTRAVAVPNAAPPKLTLTAGGAAKGAVNGTTTYYLSTAAALTIAADQPSEITVRKYSAGAAAPVLKSATNSTSLQLAAADLADKANGASSSEVVSSGLFAISAKNASGDTTLELVNIVVDTNAPFLLVD